MPVISSFFGILITMRHNDHPPAHFHAEYQGYEAFVEIRNGEIIAGKLPRSAAKLVKEWTLLHQNELMSNWMKAQQLLPLEMIAGADND